VNYGPRAKHSWSGVGSRVRDDSSLQSVHFYNYNLELRHVRIKAESEPLIIGSGVTLIRLT
jgi:hypothetical protein